MASPSLLPYSLADLTTISTSSEEPPSDDRSQQARIIALWILFLIGIVGNSLVLGWLWCNRRKTSRMNKIVLGLAVADFCVCFFVMFLSAMLTMNDYEWRVGNALCKIVQHLQSMSLMASSFMLVLLALDRHQAIRRPLKRPFPFGIYKVIGLGWACAIILSVPQLFVWKERERNGVLQCTTYGTLTTLGSLLYITYATLTQCLIPFLIITIAYARISKKIWDKARTTRRTRLRNSTNHEMEAHKDEKIALNSDPHRQEIMKQARSKTLKMSTVIILAYVICGLPFFLEEIIRVYRPDLVTQETVVAILGISAVANSAVNPYIFLFFSIKRKRKSKK